MNSKYGQTDLISASRAMSPSTLDQYLNAKVSTRHPLSTALDGELIVVPSAKTLVLRLPAGESFPDVSAFDRINFEIVELGDDRSIWFEISFDAVGMAFEAYSLILLVIEQLEQGSQLRLAVNAAISGFRSLLATNRALSEQQEIGLFGELCVFDHVLDTSGENVAMAAWLGLEGEEHDFAFSEYDIEVKTTRSETRSHLISGAGQLTQKPGRQLYLLSIQITQSGSHSDGENLAERVERIRSKLTSRRDQFDQRLEAVGLNDQTAKDLYSQRYVERSTPRAYLVDESFPALTDDIIASIVPNSGLIDRVQYRVNVTGLAPSPLAGALSSLCGGTE